MPINREKKVELLNEADFKHHLRSPAIALVTTATEGTNSPLLVEAILDACFLLEESSKNDTPIVAIERDVRTNTGTYHLNVRRLSSSVPAGKFQILISRELASGLIY